MGQDERVTDSSSNPGVPPIPSPGSQAPAIPTAPGYEPPAVPHPYGAPASPASAPGFGAPPPPPRGAPRGGDAPPEVAGATAKPELPADALTAAELDKARAIIDRMSQAFGRKVVGQIALRESMMAALIAGGHILLESVPGLAKSTAANTLAESIQAEFRRIQCTPDLLPSDIIGTQIYDAKKAAFATQLGPVHANIVLLDEINRSSAKTQSAMLEAMQERQTSIGGVVYKLPHPFLVIATQNPIEQEGTYLLPEAQLDRFLLKEVLDYPTSADEFEILERIDSGVYAVGSTTPDPLSLADVEFLQEAAGRVFVEESVRKYLIAIVQATRTPDQVIAKDLARLVDYGASPRASIAFLSAARALALIAGREYVIPEDVKRLAHRVLRHRVVLTFEADALEIESEKVIDAIIAAVPTP
jgi:MoxR-like ATPase